MNYQTLIPDLKVPKATNRQSNNSADENMTGKKIKNNHGLRQH